MIRRYNHGSSQRKNLPQCHKKMLAHRVCKNCGYYNGVAVVAHEEDK